jgi:Asp-tRNA(Asn)/Glu-tRNA(Gln) amidotransferase C subunit
MARTGSQRAVNKGATRRALKGYSDLAALGHTEARIGEIAASITDLFAAMSTMSELDVEGIEPAVGYSQPRESGVD